MMSRREFLHASKLLRETLALTTRTEAQKDERLAQQAFGNLHLSRPDVTLERVTESLKKRREDQASVRELQSEAAAEVTHLFFGGNT